MRIVLPVTRHDSAQFQNLVAIMAKLGGLERQLISIIATPSQSDLAEEQARILKPLCDEINIFRMLYEPEGDKWPQNHNAMFSFAATQLHTTGNKLPWFWMEADCKPIRAGWADKLDVLYQKKAPKFLGYIVHTPKRFPNGDPAPMDAKDQMMMGCAVYPADFLNVLAQDDGMALFKDLRNDGIDAPWDIHLRWKMKAAGWLHTPMIGDFWRTQNFRIENGQLQCDLITSDKPSAKQRMTVVTDEHWLVHGCKDESLSRLILDGQLPTDGSLLTPVSQVTQSPQVAAQVVTAPPILVEKLNRLDDLEKRVQELERRLNEPVMTSTTYAANDLAVVPNVLAPETIAVDATPANIVAWLEGGDGKTRRITQMMDAFQLSREKCLEQLAKVGWKMAELGWLKRITVD